MGFNKPFRDFYSRLLSTTQTRSAQQDDGFCQLAAASHCLESLEQRLLLSTTPINILPLGDSITHGLHYGSYRQPLWDALTSAGYNVDFIGSQQHNDQNGTPFDIDHEGHPSWRAAHFISGKDGENLSLWLEDYTPDIVLLHIGTNDALELRSAQTTASVIKSMINILRNDNPNVAVFVSNLIPYDRTPEQVAVLEELNSLLPGVVADRDTPTSRVILVDNHTGFDPVADNSDGLHPDESGYLKMAGKWFAALDAYLGEDTNPTDPGTVTVSPDSGLVTTEAGGQATFSVSLNRQPTSNVVINLSVSDASEATLSTTQLIFTPADWATKTVTVTGVDDAQVDGNINYTVVTSAAVSDDPGFSGVAVSDVSATNMDNDVAVEPGSITVTPNSGLVTSENGGQASFDITLNGPPTGNVTIDLSLSHPGEATLSTTQVVFTPGDWGPRTVTVTGLNDDIVDGDVQYTIITSNAVSSDATYHGQVISNVTATNLDNDTPTEPQIDRFGNTTTQARNIGKLRNVRTLNDHIGEIATADFNDYMRFRVIQNKINFSGIISGLSGDAYIQVLNKNGKAVAGAKGGENVDGHMFRKLKKGIYYIRVYTPDTANPQPTSYTLTLNPKGSRPAGGNNNNGGQPNVVTNQNLGVISNIAAIRTGTLPANSVTTYRFSLNQLSPVSIVLGGYSTFTGMKLFNEYNKFIAQGEIVGNEVLIDRNLHAREFSVKLINRDNNPTNFELSVRTV